MASNAGRIAQTVKPHIRLISFPKRGPPLSIAGTTRSKLESKLEEPTISQEMLKLSTHQNITSATSSSQTPASKAISGDDFSADISISSLPERFRRRSLTLEEIEFIERGGPD